MKRTRLSLNQVPAFQKPLTRVLLGASMLALTAGCWATAAHAQETPGNAPVTAGARAEAGASHEAAGGAEGEKEKGEKVSIETPTWITPLLKQIWYSGPAEITAAGSDAGSSLQGQKVQMEYEDEESHRKYPITATIVKVGDAKPEAGAHTEHVKTEGGQEVALVSPTVSFAWAKAFPEQVVIALLSMLGMALIAGGLARNLTRIPNRKQAALEFIYTFIEPRIEELIGPHYKKYVPLIMTLFLYIFVINVMGIIPGWKSPTSNINVTAALALLVVVYVQYEGIRANGIGGYLKHFMGEPAWLAPLNFPLHIIGEFAKLLSLTLRLFGNIFGEDVVIVILTYLAILFTKGFIPFQFPMYLFGIFTSFVQAMVFSILACIYIALMTTHEDHAHGHGHDHGDDGGHIEASAGYAPATPA